MAEEVFPMYVGVILCKAVEKLGTTSIPHVCGGDPELESFSHLRNVYSPCMWG